MIKTLKVLFLFICYYPSSRQPREKFEASGPRAGAIVKVGKSKLTFDCFVLSVCVCVGEVFLAAWNNIAGCLFVCLFLKCGYPGFFVDAM